MLLKMEPGIPLFPTTAIHILTHHALIGERPLPHHGHCAPKTALLVELDFWRPECGRRWDRDANGDASHDATSNKLQ